MTINPSNPGQVSSTPQDILVRHGQVIHQLDQLLESNVVMFGLRIFLSVVFQITCYLVFAGVIYLAIVLPSDLHDLLRLLEVKREVIFLVPDIEVVSEFLVMIRIVLAVVALPMLLCAFLLGRGRRRTIRMRRAYEQVEALKAGYAELTGSAGRT